MKVIIDTNVLVGACIGGGYINSIIKLCLDNHIQSIISTSLLLEYRDVFARERVFAKARFNAEERMIWLRAFVSCAELKEIFFSWRPNLVDEADNHVMELAIAANSATIITNNVRDFRSQDLKFPEIRVLTSQTFLNGWH